MFEFVVVYNNRETAFVIWLNVLTILARSVRLLRRRPRHSSIALSVMVWSMQWQTHVHETLLQFINVVHPRLIDLLLDDVGCPISCRPSWQVGITVGLASHWRCITDNSGLSTYGFNGLWKGEEYTAYAPSGVWPYYTSSSSYLYL